MQFRAFFDQPINFDLLFKIANFYLSNFCIPHNRGIPSTHFVVYAVHESEGP